MKSPATSQRGARTSRFLGSLVAATCALSSLTACGSSAPHYRVEELVQRIESDEVSAHQLRGETLLVEGTLIEKDVDTSNALLLDGQAGTSLSGQRKAPKRAATAAIAGDVGGKSYVIECTFSEFGSDKLLRTAIGSHVTVRGKLDRWHRTEFELVPSFEACVLQ
ncbi:MAG TPA: hypothetical protein VLC09_14650 [Polyangiaceae bacterium]|nr:hypothetical protein [Polyangiaceae bacterium]